jgi:uridine phosphorylase
VTKKAYHLDFQKSQIKNAKIALLPGDPFRVERISKKITQQFGGNIVELAWKREFKTILCSITQEFISKTMPPHHCPLPPVDRDLIIAPPLRGGDEGEGDTCGITNDRVSNKNFVLVTSTGIGGPSTSIVIEELAMLGVRTFIKVGTSGAIQKGIRPGDAIITIGSVRLDGASTHYAPIEYPAVAHHEIVASLIKAAIKSNVKYHVGITASSDTFYPGQDRYDSFGRYVIRNLRGSMKEWQRLHVLNYEMESSTVLTLCSSMGLRGGCVSGVIVNRTVQKEVIDKFLRLGEENAIKVAVASLEYDL